MKWTTTILCLGICCVAIGCRAFQPTPKPQSGGGMLAIIPPVQMPKPVQLVDMTNAPVQIRLVAPENAEIPTTSTWTRKVTETGVDERLTTELGTNQRDKARDAWGGIEKFKAQLATYRPIRWAGIALIVVACAGFVPQVRLIMGRSGQTAAFISGFALVFGAQMFQGNETLAMILTAVGLGVWVVARKYGILQGAVLKTQGKL